MTDHAVLDRDIIRNALATISDNMIATVVQTSRSPVVKNALDFSTAICDPQGRLVAQGLALPAHLGAIMPALAGVMRHWADDMAPGDVFINNDPYEGGSHLIDVFMFKPVFRDGDLLAILAIIVHHADIGGKVAGGQASDNVEIYQEGLRISPMRIVEKGEINETLRRIIYSNVRMPERVFADMRAQITALDVAEREFLKAFEGRSKDQLLTIYDDLIDYVERLARTEVAKLPDGEAEFTDYIDDDGLGNEDIAIHVHVKKSGDEFVIDYTGTSPQTRSSLLMNVEFTRSCSYAVIRMLMDPRLPNNAGFERVVNVITEKGSFVDPKFPASFAARGLTSHRLRQALLGALAKLMPGKLPACYGGAETGIFYSGFDDRGRYFMNGEFHNTTSLGGSAERDGQDGGAFPLSNVANTPAEIIEAENPVRVDEYALVQDTGGAGQYRGGLGINRSWTFLADDTTVQLRSDRHKRPCWGLMGGRGGSLSKLTAIKSGEDEETPLPPKGRVLLSKGDQLRAHMPGAGGYGDPYLRVPEAVLDDVREDKVSISNAKDIYGVVVNPESGELNMTETDRVRREKVR